MTQCDALYFMRKKGLGGIYVFQNPSDDRVKIGWSGNINSRFESAKTWIPDLIWIADTFSFGTMEEEQEIHKKFAHCRVANREWFALTPDLAFYIWDNFGIRTWTKELVKMLKQFVKDDDAVTRIHRLPFYDDINDLATKIGELKWVMQNEF